MSNIAHALRPALLVAADVAVGGLLIHGGSPAVGFLVLSVGLLLLVAVVHEALRTGVWTGSRDPRFAPVSDR